ncbi:uncharacterized protein IUM83_12874 [Phytophthora cinnamomi]|uniref:uncharacterized protein n=1 Tax=Phytophthora cinnamomi TaxID=4785 RepID=UPI0035599814|nr:hypothetical protein IUM83_12873 [Phytophthora cinnamomi]KAG6609027.1 hypothetical protein IUM83_12874 [Phytophthora cinnamomi]
MHLLITFESAAAAAAADQNADLVVSARFESTLVGAVAGSGDVVTAMAPGATAALPINAVMPSGQPESDWICAKKANYAYQHHFPENTILYELNDRKSPMWHYSYESGSTKAQRAMKHVLAAYVFLLHPTGARSKLCYGDQSFATGVRLTTVIARQPSPPFTMVSYRRQNNVSRCGSTTTQPGAKSVTVKLEEKRPLEYRSPSPVHLNTSAPGALHLIKNVSSLLEHQMLAAS